MKARGKRGHLTPEELTDLGRNVGSEGRLETMKQHVQSCEKCAIVADTWRRVAEVAHRLPVPEPPESAVRIAKAFYSTHNAPKPSRLKTLAAQLLFDTSLAPAQAGVRSSANSPRQLLFGSGDYRVDLRIAPEHDAEHVSVLGQVLHVTDPERILCAIPVVLFQGRRILATTQTNQFGEFQLQCELQRRLELLVVLPDSEIAIPLVEPVREPGEVSSYLIEHGKLRGTGTKGKDKP